MLRWLYNLLGAGPPPAEDIESAGDDKYVHFAVWPQTHVSA